MPSYMVQLLRMYSADGSVINSDSILAQEATRAKITGFSQNSVDLTVDWNSHKTIRTNADSRVARQIVAIARAEYVRINLLNQSLSHTGAVRDSSAILRELFPGSGSLFRFEPYLIPFNRLLFESGDTGAIVDELNAVTVEHLSIDGIPNTTVSLENVSTAKLYSFLRGTKASISSVTVRLREKRSLRIQMTKWGSIRVVLPKGELEPQDLLAWLEERLIALRVMR